MPNNHQLLDDVHQNGYFANHCSQHIPDGHTIIWANQPRLRLEFTIYRLLLIAALLLVSGFYWSEAYLIWQSGGKIAIWEVVIGTILFYFAIPHYIVKFYRLKNTYFALTPTGLWKVVYKKATPFKLAAMRNIVHVPTEGNYGNLGFLYRKGRNWKHHSLKNVTQSSVLYEALMQQLETAKTA